MTKTRSTKSALISSVVALLLCFAMLVGSTFAWFTDSVTSANNIIKSGTLVVEMYYADGTKAVPADDSADWKNADGVAIYTADQLWEPGYTDAKHIKISNEGTLALKYQLAIVPTGEVSKLAEVIDVYYIEDATQIATRDDLANYAPIGTLDDLINNGIKKGNLSANTDYTATLVLKMQENAGNEYQDLSIGDDFTIQLLATQYTEESDSFDNQYDAGSPWLSAADIDWYVNDPDATEFEINTPEQLAGLAAIVNGTATVNVSTYASTSEATTIKDDFAGQTIKLTGNVDLNNVNWTPIGTKAAPFKGTFDGQGYTVSNLYIDDIDNPYQGLFGYVSYKSAMIKGVNVHNVNITGYSNVGSIAGEVYVGSISDCHVTGSVELLADYAYAGGIVGGTYVHISDCSVIADGMGEITINQKTGAGGICGWHTEGAYEMSNCHVKNLNITAYTNLGGITGFVHYQNVIDGCSVENVTLTKTRVDGHPGIGMAAGGWSYNASNAITITNNTFKNITFNGNYVAVESADLLHGSEYSGKLTKNFVLDNNTQENITNNMVEVTKVADGIVDNNGVYQIYNAKGLVSLGGTKISGTYELMADLDMTGLDMKSMVLSGGATVVFEGNGYTISNLTLGAANLNGMTGAGNEVAGLFDLTAPATTVSLTVNDLAFENATVACNGYSAVVAGYNSNGGSTITLNNVDVKGATVTAESVAGLVGYTTGVVNLTDCDVSGLALTGEAGRPDKVGALVGTANTATSVVTVLNCTNATTYNYAGRVINGAAMTIGGVAYVTNADGLAQVVANGATNILLADGEYDVKNCGGKTMTISGSANAVIKVMNEGESGCDYGFDGSTVTFDGVTFDTSLNNGNYKGFARMKGIYNECTFNGSYALNDNGTFTKCVFNVSGDAYNLWTWGAPEATFTGCTFDSDGKAVLLYGGTNTKLTLDTCVFNDNGGLTDLKAAIEIGNDYNKSYELIVNNTVVNGYEINDKGINTGSTLWGNKNSMGTDKLNVVVDGVDVY